MFKNPFSFQGRIRRLEYNLTLLIFVGIILSILIGIINWQTPIHDTYFWAMLPIVYILYVQRIKRCHDLGKSGWYMFTFFAGFKLMFDKGEIGENQYGPDPKGLQATSSPDVLDDMIQ